MVSLSALDSVVSGCLVRKGLDQTCKVPVKSYPNRAK